MSQSEFEAQLRRDGYQVVYNGQPPNHQASEHTHPWDARILVLGGAITLTRGGIAETFTTGASCEVPANTLHSEQVGPQGVAYLAGRRTPA